MDGSRTGLPDGIHPGANEDHDLFSKFNHAEKQSSLAKGENRMHSKEGHLEGEYPGNWVK
jgi:hypothetical protein